MDADMLCEPLMRLQKFRKNLLIAMSSFKGDIQEIVDIELSQTSHQSYRMMAGNAAEFSFDASQTCIGDIDSMTWSIAECACFNFNDEDMTVLINKKHLMNKRTTLYNVTSCEQYPGYVRVELYGCVNVYRETDNSDTWVREPCTEKKRPNARDWATCYVAGPYVKTAYRGPAIKTYKPSELSSGRWYGKFDEDLIFCLNCLFWPPEASGWSTRCRRHQWPSQETIALVVENGCHIVPVAHIDCSKDQYQWRISFSKAELILIKSWSQGQQYVYHLLRYFAKKELLKEDWRNTDEILSTYTLKTLMLWRCERKSSEWWHFDNDRELCSKLLKLLNIILNWLLDLKCRNYFITDCNLFDHEMNKANFDVTIEKLSLFENVNQLMKWFHDNYRSKDYPPHPDISKLSIRDILSKVAETDERFYKLLHTSECYSFLSLPTQAMYVTCGRRDSFLLSRERCLRQIGMIEGVFVDFYKAHVLLQVSTKYTTGHKADYLVAMLSSLFLNQPRFWETIPQMKQYDVFLMIERERYYELAEDVLEGYTTNYETDHHLQIKLGKTLIKKS